MISLDPSNGLFVLRSTAIISYLLSVQLNDTSKVIQCCIPGSLRTGPENLIPEIIDYIWANMVYNWTTKMIVSFMIRISSFDNIMKYVACH